METKLETERNREAERERERERHRGEYNCFTLYTFFKGPLINSVNLQLIRQLIQLL
jgi:hypothetical protein